MADKLIRGLARNGNIRVLMVKSTDLVQNVKEIHDLFPTVTAAVGRTMNASLMMAHALKDEDEKLIIEIRGNGDLKFLLVNADNAGRVRTTVSNPHLLKINEHNGKLDVGGLFEGGTLKVSRSIDDKIVYNSLVDLQSGEIGDDFAYYFAQSEQIPSVVSLGVLVGEDYNVLSAGGLIIQVLPSAQEEDIVAMETLLQELKPMSTYFLDMEAEALFEQLFEDGEILGTSDIEYHCGCNRDQMLGALMTLSTDDLQELIDEDQGAKMICHYCNTEYEFSESELKAIIDEKQ